MSVTGAAVPYVSLSLLFATHGHWTGFGRFGPGLEFSQFDVYAASRSSPKIRSVYP